MKTAAVILNYNSAKDCKHCISSLLRQSVPVEIIALDNASKPDDRSELEEFCREKNLTLLLNPENRGYNAGNNTGLRHAAQRGFDAVLIANPDMEFPDPDYIKKLSDCLESDSRLAVAASDILHIEGYHQNPMSPNDGWRESFACLAEIFKTALKRQTSPCPADWQTDRECFKVSGCALLIRMSFLEKNGFFDEYPLLYCEEAILSKQVKRSGMKMFYLAGIQAVHRHIAKNKGKANPRLRQFLRSRLYFIRKYSGDPWYGKLTASLVWLLWAGSLMSLNALRKR